MGFLIKPPFIPSSFSLGLLAEISSQFSGSKEILSGERGPAFNGKGSQRLSPFKHVDRAVWLREVLDTRSDGGNGIGHILASLTDFSKPVDSCGGDLIALRAAV